ncbi:recombinase family protein [Jhaorihella thermophila]
MPDGTFTTGEREVDEVEAEIVRRIFTEYLQGDSPRTIASRLNRDGIKGPRSSAWSASTIYGNWKRGTGILNNELYLGRLVWNRQSFIKDPDTGKRQARPNPPEEWVIEEVPHLRIVDDELWNAVKARQQEARKAMGVDGSARPERARRPRYLFSGLLVCGACGGGYTLVGKSRYGCAAARNKGTCDNRRSIERQTLEERVLDGLRHHLLDAELIAEFVETYRREYNALRRVAEAEKVKARRDLAKVEKQIEQIVEAVCEGLYHPSMKEKLTRLEARKAELTELLSQKEEEPLRLHPGLADVYRKKIDALVEALNAEGEKGRSRAHPARPSVGDLASCPKATGWPSNSLASSRQSWPWKIREKNEGPEGSPGPFDNNGCGGRI